MAEVQEITVDLGKKRVLDDIKAQLAGKRVLMRVDFNVPLDGKTIKDNKRIKAALPSINYCLNNGCKAVILMSHLGRPKGQRKEELSLAPVARELALLLNREVLHLPDCVGEQVEKACADPPKGGIILLENLRFHPEETGKGVNAEGEEIKPSQEETDAFRASLSKLGDVYVNDAFGTAHRAHSSMVGVNLPVRVAGKLMEKELANFGKVLNNAEKPFCAILGGAKISDKILLIENLLDKVDKLIIGGGMAFSFLNPTKTGEGMKIGDSLYDESAAELVPKIFAQAKEKNVEIVLPVDFVCGNKFAADAEMKEVTLEEGIPDGWMGLDCGKKSQQLFKETLQDCKTILWNGPPGVFEFQKFAKSTRAMLNAIITTTRKNKAVSIIGGGDTASAVKKFGGIGRVTHISTGGGASLELLEGKILPGIAALSDKTN